VTTPIRLDDAGGGPVFSKRTPVNVRSSLHCPPEAKYHVALPFAS
jgi:hypothetical protein